MKYTLILLAGGIGKRMGVSIPKQLMLIRGKPMLLHSILAAEKVESISEIVVTCPKDHKEAILSAIQTYGIKTPIKFVDGGVTRQESVYLGAKAASSEWLLVHEAARPVVTPQTFETLIKNPADAAIYGIDIPFTVLFREGGKVSGLIERDRIFNVQLPHKFKKDVLLNAHEKARSEKRTFTEDASLLFHYGVVSTILEGRSDNIKVTTPEDLIATEGIMSHDSE